MPQRYKVRLGDGTVISVDQDRLRTWAGDGRAMAQAVGTQAWRPLQDLLVEEEAAARLARALIPPQPRQEATPASPLEIPEFDLRDEPSLAGPAPMARPSLQVLADDPAPGRAVAPGPAAAAADDMPVIPMKPLDDEPVFRSAFSESEEVDEDEYVEENERRSDRLDGPLLSVLETGGGFLSRVLNRLTPLANRLTAPTAQDPFPSRDATDDAGPEEDERPTLLARASEWLRGLGARLRRPAPEEPLTPDEEPDDAAWTPPPPPARKAVSPPTPLAELPALRFVESREPRPREDVYTGRAMSRSLNLQPLWDWTKWIVTTGALVAALVYAFLERDVWLPRTAELGQTVFTLIDRQVLSRERSQQQQQALAEAASRLPELAPETILLVFARSPTGVVEAGEVFQIAREAADRGLGALTPEEAEELQALASELLATLSRTEAERVREYDRTRARRVIFPFENPHVMELVARGARALPPERLERLKALSHKAVAAGLDLPEATVAPSAAP
jgi:hypothetical protein